MEFSKLDRYKQIVLISELDKLKLEYRKKLNFDENLTFGVEIEYGNAKSNKVERVLKKFSENPEYGYYGKWNFTNDPNFTKFKDGVIYGGEVKTPIFSNDEEKFEELKIMCDKLNKFNAIIDDRMGLHIHVSKDIFSMDEIKLIKFLKMYAVYEHIIYKFGYNGKYPREVLESYAYPIRKTILDIINSNSLTLNFNHIVHNLNERLLSKESGVNFANLENGILSTNTVEFRMCNGTIDPIVIQNEINLFCNLLLKIKSDNYDIDYIDYRFDKLYSSNIGLDEYKKIYMDDALEFSDIVFDDDTDKKYFLKQYLI